MTTLFISDLHLCAERPAITRLFLDFLAGEARDASVLYILGDLFEAWLGDDAPGHDNLEVLQGLRHLTDHGVEVYVMPGNRDFLLGHQFELMTGCHLIAEPQVVNLYGTPTLLMHGDSLCTDDVEYQKFRLMVRNPKWIEQVLALSVDQRIALARELRQESTAQNKQKRPEIMDVNEAEVVKVMESRLVTRLIHGHTHRPAIHDLTVHDKPAQRVVLGDWYDQGSVLVCDDDGLRLEGRPLKT